MNLARHRELEQCNQLWHLAKVSKPQFAMLVGTAGLGKSYFLRNFLSSISVGSGVLVKDSSFLTGLLRSAFTVLQNEREPGFLSAAKRFCPELTWTVLAKENIELQREQAWLAVAHALERVAVRLGGLCILLEDIHAFNSDDITALRFMYRQWLHNQTPIFLLASTRPSLDTAIFEGLETDALLAKADTPIKLELHALDFQGITLLIQSMLPNADVPAELSKWIFTRSEGHPLYASELLRFLISGGAIQNLGATWQFQAPPDTTVPHGLEAVLLSRLATARAENQVWFALSNLAVLGHAVTQAEWTALCQLPNETMQRISRRLVTLGLVRATLTTAIARFEPAHPLYPPLIQSLQTESETIANHQRALTVTQDIRQRARHARACEHPEALQMTQEALMYFQNNYQWADYFENAEIALGYELTKNERTELLETMTNALVIQTQFQAAIDLIEKQQLNTPRAIRLYSYCLARLVRDREGFDYTNRHIAALNWEIRYYWTCFPMRLGMQEVALARLQEAFILSAENSDERYTALMCQHWYAKIYEPHSLGKQIELFEQIYKIEEILTGSVTLWYWQAEAFTELGEITRAQNMMQTILEHFRIKPNDGSEANLLVALARVKVAQENYLEARQHYLAALRVATSSLDWIHQSYAHYGLYICDYALGLEITQHLERYHATNASMHFIRYDAPKDLEIAWREASLGRLEATERSRIQPLLDAALGSDCFAAARLYLLENNHQAALEVLKRWQPQVWQEVGMLKTQQKPAEYALLEGLAQRHSGKKSVAARAFAEAKEIAVSNNLATKLLEIELALSLVAAAPNAAALEQLRSLGAIGQAQWLRILFAGALESLEFHHKTDISNTSTFIRTLGTFGLEENGKLKPWKAQKPRELLALLICASLEQNSGFITREEILDTVWANNDPSTADGAFRVTVSRLRDTLGNAAKIERDSQGRYGLVNANLDISQFLTAIEKHDLERAVTWYNGEYLPSIDLEKVNILREKLRAYWRETMLKLAFEHNETRAATIYEQLLESDPLDLEALQGLAKSWQALGANLRLLRVLEKSKDRFTEDVGELPHELTQLLRHVRSSSFVVRQ